jgi:hypothetical protein
MECGKGHRANVNLGRFGAASQEYPATATPGAILTISSDPWGIREDLRGPCPASQTWNTRSLMA